MSKDAKVLFEQIRVEKMYLICFVEISKKKSMVNFSLQKLEDLLKANEEEKKVRVYSAFG